MSTKKRIVNWINNFVAVFNPEFGGIPCPYAAAAMKKNKVVFKWSKNMSTLEKSISKVTDMPADKDVLMWYLKKEDATLDDIYNLTETYNTKYKDENVDLFLLFDHPGRQEYIKGVHMNFSEDVVLVLLQKASKLDKAREQLHADGFYDDWDEQAYRRVVNGEKV